jgi:hypothetical protein
VVVIVVGCDGISSYSSKQQQQQVAMATVRQQHPKLELDQLVTSKFELEQLLQQALSEDSSE